MAEKTKAIAVSMALAASDLFKLFDDSSSSSDDDTQEKQRLEGFVDVVVPSFDDTEFRRHFRVGLGTFEVLVGSIGRHVSNDDVDKAGRRAIDVRSQLLMALWILATPDSYRSVALKFGCSKSVLWTSVHRVVDALLAVNNDHHVIQWPTGQEAANVVEGFNSSGSIPGVVGAIDGSHINIKAPKHNSAAYINRKGVHSVVLQAVCTSDMRFTDCYAGEVGAVHDATVWKRSDLYHRMMTDAAMFAADTHLIGDAAYPVMKNLMVPFKDTGSLTARQQRYNALLSSSRCVIERAFALLKGRFRRLKFLDMSRVDLIPKVIVACCVLHNICLDNCDIFDDAVDLDSEGSDAVADTEAVDNAANRQLAVAKRNAICAAL